MHDLRCLTTLLTGGTVTVHAEAVLDQQSPEPSSPPVQPTSAHMQPAQTAGEPATTSSSHQSHALASASQQDAPGSRGAAALDSAAQSKPLPIADMAALARRIGMASKTASQAAEQRMHTPALHYASAGPGSAIAQTIPSSGQAAAAGNSASAVPAEIQAIIHKLVHFIKVGPSRPCLSSLWTSCLMSGTA